MRSVTPLFAIAAVAGLALLAFLLWRSQKASRVVIRQLRQRIAELERERTLHPAPRLVFEFNGSTREALLHVTNDGGDAEMWGLLSVEGALSRQLKGDVCAAWGHGGGPRAMIRRGQTRTLRLAQLDLSVFPYAQWQIYLAGPAKAGHDGNIQTADVTAIRAQHTSMIGGDPETHAAALFIQVALMTAPDAVSPTPHCTIALKPFEAIRLRPI